MTAIISPAYCAATAEASSLTAQLEEFLRDPIDYGSYDFTDPITLAEFVTTAHYHCLQPWSLS